MTGTASTLNEYPAPGECYPEQPQRFINRLSNWLFGQDDMVYGNCVLTGISADGGEILIPKHMIIPGNIFDVVVHAPESTDMASVMIRAELLWSDIDHSQTYIKIGFGFVNNSITTRRAVINLVDHAARKDMMNYDCSLIF